MPFSELFKTVVEPQLCTSCGACEFVCPNNLIVMDELKLRFTGEKGDDACAGCNRCSEVCPGKHTNVTQSELALYGRTRSVRERWLGIYQRQLLAHSLEPDIYAASSSGGCATSFLLAAKKQMHLDYLVVAGRETARPWRAASRICRTKAELLEATQSTYQLFPHMRILKNIRENDPMAMIGIVALPCQVQALRKLQRMEGPVAEYARRNIRFVLEIACSSSTLPQGTETLIEEEARVCRESVKNVRFREGEYPGDFVVHLRDGKKKTVMLWKAVEHFKKHKTYRCLSCGDWMSGLSDISVCDGDPNIFKSSAMVGERVPKHGMVLVRTRIGKEVLDAAMGYGLIAAFEGEAVERMNLGLERKRNRRAYYESMSNELPEPPIKNYREQAPSVSDDDVIRESLAR